MLFTKYIIDLYNKGFSRKYISRKFLSYNKHFGKIINEEDALKFVECVIVDYITSPSL